MSVTVKTKTITTPKEVVDKIVLELTPTQTAIIYGLVGHSCGEYEHMQPLYSDLFDLIGVSPAKVAVSLTHNLKISAKLLGRTIDAIENLNQGNSND